MSSTRVLSLGVLAVSFLGVLEAAFPLTAHAAWVNSDGAFQVGGELTTIVPTHLPAAPPGSDGASFANPTCSQESTSLALVSGSKLAGVDPVLHPAVLVVSCLGGSDADQKRLNFVTPTLFSPPIGPWKCREADPDDERAEQWLGPPGQSPGQGRPPRLREQRRSLQHRLQPDDAASPTARRRSWLLRLRQSPAVEDWPGMPTPM